MRNFIVKRRSFIYKKCLNFFILPPRLLSFHSKSHLNFFSTASNIKICLIVFFLLAFFQSNSYGQQPYDQDYRDTMEFLEKTVQFLQEENDNLSKERENFLEKIQRQEVIINEHKISINHLLGELKNIKKQRADYKQDIEDLSNKMKSLENENRSSLTQLERRDKDFQALNDNFVRMKEEREALVGEKQDLQTKEKEVSEQIAVLSQQNSSLKDTLEKNEKELGDALAKLQERKTEIEKISLQAKQATIKNEEYEKKIDNLDKAIIAFKKQTDTMAAEAAVFKENLVNLKSSVSALEDEKKSNLAMIDDLQKENKKKQDELVRIKVQDLEKLQKEKVALTDTIEDYRGSLLKNRNRLIQVEKENQAFNDKLVKLEESLVNTANRNKELENEKIELTKKAKDLESVKKELNLSQEDKQILTQKFSKEKEELSNEINKYKDSLEKVTQKQAQVASELLKANREKEDILQAKAILIKEKNDFLKQIEDKKKLSETLKNLENQNRQYVNNIGILEKEAQKYKSSLSEIKSELGRTNKQRGQFASELLKANREKQDILQAKAILEKEKQGFLKQIDDLGKLKQVLAREESKNQEYVSRIGQLDKEIEEYKDRMAEKDLQMEEKFKEATAKWSNTIEEYKNSVAQLQNQLSQDKTEKEKLAIRIAGLNNKNNILEKEKEKLIKTVEELDAVKNELRLAKDQNNKYLDKVKILEKEMDKQKQLAAAREKESINKFNRKEAELNNVIEEYKIALNKAMDELNQEKEEKEKFQKKITNLDETFNLVKDRNKNLEKEKQDLIAMVQDLNKFRDEFKKIEKQNQEYVSKIDFLEKEGQEYKKLLIEQAQKINAERNQFASTTTELNTKLNRIEKAKQEATDKLAMSEKAKAQADKSNSQLQGENRQLTEKAQQLVKVSNDLKLLEGKNQELLGRISLLEEDTLKYKELLAQQQTQEAEKIAKATANLQDMVDKYKTTASQVSAKLEEANKKNNEYAEKIDDLKRAVEDSHVANKFLQKDKENLEVAVKNQTKEIKAFKQENEWIKEQFAKKDDILRNTADQLQVAKNTFSKEIAALQEKLKQHKTLLIQEEDKIQKYAQQQDKLNGIINDYKIALNKANQGKEEYINKIATSKENEVILQKEKDVLAKKLQYLSEVENDFRKSEEDKQKFFVQVDSLEKEKSALVEKLQYLSEVENDFRKSEDDKQKLITQLKLLKEEIKKNNNLFTENSRQLQNKINVQMRLLAQKNKQNEQYANKINELEAKSKLTDTNYTSAIESNDMLNLENQKLVKKNIALEKDAQDFKNEFAQKSGIFKTTIEKLEEEKELHNKKIAVLEEQFVHQENRLKDKFAQEKRKMNGILKKQQIIMTRLQNDLRQTKLAHKEYTDKMAGLENRIAVFKEKETDFNKERTLLVEKLKGLERIDRSYNELKLQSQKYLAQLNLLKEEKQKYQKILVKVKAQLKNKFSGGIKALKDMNSQYKASLDEATSQLKETNLKNMEYSSRIGNLEEALRFLKQGYVSLEKEKEMLKAAKEDQFKEIAALKENSENLKNIFTKKEQIFNDTIKEFQGKEKRFKNISGELKQVNINKEKYASKINNLNKEINSLEDRIKYLHKENSMSAEKTQNLQNMVKDYETKLQQQVSTDREKYMSKINNLNKEINSLEDRIKYLQKENNIFAEKTQNLQSAVKNHKIKLQQQQVNIDKKKYIGKINNLNKEINLLENRIKNLHKENNMFVEKTQNLQNMVKDYETKKEQNQKYIATIDVLQKEIAKYNKLFSQYKETGNIAQASDKSQQLKERICYLEEKCDNLEKEKDELVKSFETKKFYDSVSLKKENARLRRVLAEMSSRFESHEDQEPDGAEQKYYSEVQSLR